jgi:dolichol-phosphate mannosyltransferase
LTDALEPMQITYELVFVDDGSRDSTLSLLRRYSLADDRVKYLSLSRNFGHQNAIMAGLSHAAGSALVIMDGDLQDPPEVIPELYAKFRTGYAVVYGRRMARAGEHVLKSLTATVFYRVLKRMTSVEVPVDTGDFRLISRRIATALAQMHEPPTFLRGQIAWLGFRQTVVEYPRSRRYAGRSKFTSRTMIRFAADGITSLSSVPLRLVTWLGVGLSAAAVAGLLYALYVSLVLGGDVAGWTAAMITTMLIGGMQMLGLGIVGAYVSRVVDTVRKRPAFVIEETNVQPRDEVRRR